MAALFFADPAQQAIAAQAREEAFKSIFGRFAACWAADPCGPDPTPEEIVRLRHAYALPLFMGALQACADFVWEVAPADANVDQLVATLDSNIAIVADRTLAAGPSGGFWRHVAQEVASAADLAREG